MKVIKKKNKFVFNEIFLLIKLYKIININK